MAIYNNFSEYTLNLFRHGEKFFEVDDCYVDQYGFVFKDGELIHSLAIEHIIWLGSDFHVKHLVAHDDWWASKRGSLIYNRMNSFSNYFKNLKTRASVVDLNGVALHLMHPFRRYEYGHFFDTFQKTYLSNEVPYFDSVLLSDVGKINDFDSHAKCLGLHGKRRVFIQPDVIYKVSKLIYIYPPSPATNFSENSLKVIRNRYISEFLVNDSSIPKKLFLTRKPGLSRSLNNYEEVHDSLVRNGVEIIDGSESLGVMVESFANASHIAAVHGSILANSFLVGSSCKFLEYCPENRPDFTFRNKLKLSSIYDHRLVQSDEEFNMNLNVSELLSFYNS